MNTTEKIDRYLTESELFGECWHDVDEEEYSRNHHDDPLYKCAKCDDLFLCDDEENKTLHSPEGFFRLWETMREREGWWLNFSQMKLCSAQNVQGGMHYCPEFKHINPQTFPRLVAEWLGWEEEK